MIAGAGVGGACLSVRCGNAGGVAVDGADVDWAVEWSGEGSGTIGRANLDGTGVNQSFITGGKITPTGVAVDGAHVYWANYVGNTIGRADGDGTGVNQSCIAANSPLGVAVDLPTRNLTA